MAGVGGHNGGERVEVDAAGRRKERDLKWILHEDSDVTRERAHGGLCICWKDQLS